MGASTSRSASTGSCGGVGLLRRHRILAVVGFICLVVWPVDVRETCIYWHGVVYLLAIVAGNGVHFQLNVAFHTFGPDRHGPEVLEIGFAGAVDLVGSACVRAHR